MRDKRTEKNTETSTTMTDTREPMPAIITNDSEESKGKAKSVYMTRAEINKFITTQKDSEITAQQRAHLRRSIAEHALRLEANVDPVAADKCHKMLQAMANAEGATEAEKAEVAAYGTVGSKEYWKNVRVATAYHMIGSPHCHNITCKKYLDLLMCQKCELALYCSKKCQGDHWEFHRLQCKKTPEQIEQVKKLMEALEKRNKQQEAVITAIKNLGLNEMIEKDEARQTREAARKNKNKARHEITHSTSNDNDSTQ